MPSTHSSETEHLWKRVGLEELRRALSRIEALTTSFEHALQKLPPCSKCARAHLLERIRTASGELSSETASLSVPAATLQQAAAAAEQTEADLMANEPKPCRCEGGPCTCHE